MFCSRRLTLPLLVSVLIIVVFAVSSGCSRIRSAVADAKAAAQLIQQPPAFSSVDDLKSDVSKPPGAAEILMAHFVVKGAKDEDLAAFNSVFCQDLSLRVTRLPEVRGQVPGWVVDEAMKQYHLTTMGLDAQQAMKMARLSGRRHAMVGTLERQRDKMHIRVEVYDAKTAKRVGEPIEISGTPQELLDGEGRLAQQIAERIGVKLTEADRKWLNRRQFRTLDDMTALGRLMMRGGKDYAAQIARLREREPDSSQVESEWLKWTAFKDNQAYLAALEDAHKRFPEEPTFLRWIIETHMKRGDKARAKAALDEFLKLYPGSWEGLNVRARYYHYMEQDREAGLRATESMAVLYPDCWLSWRRCAREALLLAYYARAGYYLSELNGAQRHVFARGMSEALAAGERALACNNQDVDLLTDMVAIYRENGMPKQAQKAFDQAIAIDPGHVAAYDELAAMYRRGYENDEQRRMAILKRCVAAPARTPADIQKQAEIALYALKEKDRALKLYGKAFAASGNSPSSDLHLSYAEAVGREFGRWEESEKHARIAVRQVATANGYLTLGMALYNLKRPKEALAAAREAKRLEPDNPDCDASIAAALSDLGRVDEAFRLMRKTYEKDPRNVQYLGNIVTGYLDQGDYDKAWQVMEEIKRHPFWEDSDVNMRTVGDVHAVKGHFEEAIKYYDKYLKGNDGDTKSLTRGALCYMMLKDFTHAAPRWRTVFAKEPNHAESHLGLALSLKMLGKTHESMAEARKAIAADAKVGDPKYLTKERYWPEPLSQAAAELAAAARQK
jgi:tetratricopeptide (TPR) repeat protein